MIVSPHLVKPLSKEASRLPMPGEEYRNYQPGLYEMQLGETGDFDPDGPGFWP
jgi:pilus assembly protein CpaC